MEKDYDRLKNKYEEMSENLNIRNEEYEGMRIEYD